MSDRKQGGVYVLVAVAIVVLASILTVAVGKSHRDLALQKAPFGRMSYVPSFDPIQDVTLGLPPDASNDDPKKPSPTIRGIMIYPTQAILLAGGQVHRVIDLAKPVASLPELVRVVHDPTWLSQSGGRVTLEAAVVVQGGTAMTIAAPAVTKIILRVRPGVFLAANQARLTLAGVSLAASDYHTPASGSRVAVRRDLGRPFVLANDHSVLRITRCTFRNLGRDWNSSYGVAWSKGSTGSVAHSLFERNFIGIYTDHSKGLRVTDNVFRENSLYGVDPHSHSSQLVITGNVAERNGRHGIIFSDHVTGGIVRNNIARDNGLNGIMMDEASTGNRIDHNVVTGNRSDGIVLADSGNNDLTYNTVHRNRVGIHVRGAASTQNVASRNVIRDNDKAAQGISLHDNTVQGNGGQWLPSVIVAIWSWSAVLGMALCGLTWWSRRRRDRHIIRRTPPVSVGVS